MAVGVKIHKRTSTLYIHKYEIWQEYGGPEEGGWWYTWGRHEGIVAEVPLDSEVDMEEYESLPWGDRNRIDVDFGFNICRALNHNEQEREKQYGFTSVLSYKENHYDFDISDSPMPDRFQGWRPHYE
jgi:hypothetical protein